MGARDQAWSSGEGHEDQVPGGDLPVFSAHQGEGELDLHLSYLNCFLLQMSGW